MTEVNIFSYISDICFKKTKKYCNLSNEQLNFYPFLLQRWLSMSSNESAFILNETTNKWLTVQSSDKQLFYKITHSVLPKQKQKKINYIKKNSTQDADNLTKDLSLAVELSTKEVKSLLKELTYYNDCMENLSRR